MPTDMEIMEWLMEKLDQGAEALGPHALKFLFAALVIINIVAYYAGRGG